MARKLPTLNRTGHQGPPILATPSRGDQHPITYVFRAPTRVTFTRLILRRLAEIEPNLLLSLLPTTLKPFQPEEDDWARSWGAAYRQLDPQSQNLLLTVLAQTAAAAPFVQEMEDWDRPMLLPRQPPSDAIKNLLLTVLPTTLAPFVKNNDHWARQQYVYTRTADAYQNRLILPTTLAPFISANWPAWPSVRSRVADAIQNLLLTTLAQTVTYLDRGETLLPLPCYTHRQTWDPQNLLLTLLAQVSATPFIARNDDQPRFMASRRQEVAQNLLATVLPTTLKPLIAADWTQSHDTTGRISDATYNTLPTLLPTTLAPLNAKDWPAPPRMTTRIAEAAQNLLTTALAVTPAKAVIPLEWGRPTSPSRVRQSEAVQNVLATLLPTTAAPFKAFEWPALPRTRPQVAEAVQNLLTTTLSQVVTYLDRGETRLPTPFYLQRQTWDSQNLLVTLLTTPQATPFVPQDWTTPSRQAVRQAEAVHNLLATLLPTTLAPFVPQDWTQEDCLIPRPSEPMVNLLASTLAPPPGAPPFVPQEWVVVLRSSLRQHEATSNPLLTLLPLTLSPFVSYDWTPSPKDRAPHVSVIEQNNRSLADFIPPVVPPATINYQAADGPKKKKKKRETQEELFHVLERTVLDTMAGPYHAVATAVASPHVEVSRTLDDTMHQLLAAAGDSYALSLRVAHLRRDVAHYEQQRRLDADEEEWMML